MSKDWGVQIPGGYFTEEGHTYRNAAGVIVPSATQVLELNGLSDFSFVNEADLLWKREYGLAVHTSVEYMATGDLDWDTLEYENPVIVAPVRGIEEKLKAMEFEVEAVEERRIADVSGMQFGMTTDLRGSILHRGHRRKVIIDLKTGSKFSQTWTWQLGGYLTPQPKVQGGWMGVILQVFPQGKVVPHYVTDTDQVKREFQVLLAASILKMNHGFATL